MRDARSRPRSARKAQNVGFVPTDAGRRAAASRDFRATLYLGARSECPGNGCGIHCKVGWRVLVKSQPPTRREILFDGRVQGVGFRYTTRNIAERFNVTGYVQNLPDGRVKLVVEGQQMEAERFIAAVLAEMASYIRGQQETKTVATGEFDAFEVRR